jgi:hypothetical protein
MARIQSVPAQQAGLLAKATYAASQRKLGRVAEPLGIMAHSPAILAANCAFELGLERARVLPTSLKTLASVRAAMMVGCPF